MQGRFVIDKFDARGLGDEDFNRAIKDGSLNGLLGDLPHLQKCGGSNRIYDRMASYLFMHLFQSPNGQYPEYDNVDGSRNSMLAAIVLSTEDRDPSYTYERHYNNSYSYRDIQTWPYNVGHSPAKRFEEDQIEPWTVWTDSDGREAVNFRNKFLWLPTEAYNSTIRSICIVGLEDADTLYQDYGWWRVETGFIRLKDVDGNKVVLSKSSNEVLLVEYTFTLVSM